jgi:outer membrane protein assembly factor BamB
MSRTSWIVILVTLSCAAVSHAGDWPAFRGPKGNGISAEKNVPISWGPNENVQWKAELPRSGNGSPIVSNGRVFLTCAEDDKGLKRSLYCFDRSDGKRLWERTIDFDKQMPTHKTNAYCGSTPVADGERVVVWHSSAGLYCYDFDGNKLWSRDLGEFRHMWGYGSSPVLYDGKVILNCGPGKRTFMTALELKTGKTIWETDEPFKGDGDKNENGKYMGSWSTPVIAHVDGSEQVICTMPTRVNGYDPNTGDIIWTCDGIRGPKGDLAYSSPMISGNLCVALGGFSGPGLGLELGGKGNITETSRLWRIEKNPQSIGSGVFIGKHVYRANAGRPSPVQCLNPITGDIVWNGPAGGSCWGSIVSADGRLYVTNQAGTTIVFKSNPNEFELVAENHLREPSNSTPAISDSQIFIRTFRNLYCIARSATTSSEGTPKSNN